jgi:hypothetical protein
MTVLLLVDGIFKLLSKRSGTFHRHQKGAFLVPREIRKAQGSWIENKEPRRALLRDGVLGEI